MKGWDVGSYGKCMFNLHETPKLFPKVAASVCFATSNV